MAEGINLANVYYTLIPTTAGAQKSIADAIVPGAEAAGAEAGGKAGFSLAGAMKNNLGKLMTGAAFVGAFTGLYQIGSTFDDVTDTIRTGTGATGEALVGLTDVAKQVGSEIPAEWGEIGSTVADLNTRLGLSGDTLKTVSEQYLEAGRILGEDVDIQSSTAAFSAFKIEGDGVSKAMDTMFQVSQSTGVSMNDLSSGVQAQASALQNLGFSFDDSVALMGTLDKAGLNSSQVMGSMGKGLVNLAKDGEEPQSAFKRVTGEIQGFVDAGDTAAALDLASQIFGTKGANQFVGALQSGAMNMDDLMGATGATSDTILGVADDTADFAEQWQLVKNNAQLALEPLASTVFSALGSALGSVLPALQSFGGWLADNQWVLGVVAGIIGVTLVAAFVSWTASVWASTAALLANPVTWVVIGIMALIAGLVLLIANWDSVVQWLSSVWNASLEWVKSSFSAVGDWFGSVWASITGFFTSAGTAVSSAWQSVLGFFQSIPGAIGGFFAGIGAKVSSGFKSGAQTVTNVWNAVLGWFRGLPGAIGSAISSIASKISAPFKSAFNAVASFWNNTVGKLSWSVPNWIPGMGGKYVGAPKLPMLATGGTATAAGWSMVGELGPELLHLPRGASVVPLDHPASALATAERGGASGYGIVYNDYSTVVNPVAEPASTTKRRKAQKVAAGTEVFV